MRACIAMLLAGAMLAACSPKAAPVAEAAAPPPAVVAPVEPANPFFGTWSLVSAQIAPWWDKKGETPAADPAFTSVTFAADKSSGPQIVACDKPQYSVSIANPRILFEGNLPDPVAQATAMGFKSQDITQLNFGCASGSRDVSLDFPMIDQDTILLGLDNVIYRLKRTGG